MAVFAFSTLLPGLKFRQLNQFEHHPHRRSGPSSISNHPTLLQLGCMNRQQISQSGEPNRVQDHLSGAKEKFWNSIQELLKMFRWDKAADKMQERLHKALKWSLVALLAFSSLSDAVYAIYRDQELIIPLGLFVGCLLADFVKEISEEAVGSTVKGWQLLAIASVFLFFKFMSLQFALGPRVFLLHVANGGLMQLFWIWRNSVVRVPDGNETN